MTGVATSVMFIEATVFQILYSFFGTLNGPLLGVFVMGMMLPWTNAKVTMFSACYLFRLLM